MFMAAVLGFVAGAVFGSWVYLFATDLLGKREATPRDPLSEALGPYRLTEGRMGYEQVYARYPTSPGNLEDPIVVRFIKEHSRNSTGLHPRDRRARALAYFVSGKIDNAISELEAEVERAPEDAELLANLSALYDRRANFGRRPVDSFSALARSSKAARIAPEIERTHFNQALALEHLFLWEESLESWRRYLKLDPDSDWSQEARVHILQVTEAIHRNYSPAPYILICEAVSQARWRDVEQLASQSPWEARRALEDVLIGQWLGAMAEGEKSRARNLLTGVKTLSKILDRKGGDRVFKTVYAAMVAVEAVPSSRHRVEEALRPLLLYRETIRLLGSRDLSRARRRLDLLSKSSVLRDYPSLAARRWLLVGRLAWTEKQPNVALDAYQIAQKQAVDLGDKQLVAWIEVLIGEMLENLGRSNESWKHIYRSLAWSSRYPDRSQLLSTLDTAVLLAVHQGRLELALHLQNRIASLTANLPARGAFVAAKLRRSKLEVYLGRSEEANLDFREAIRELPKASASVQRLLATEIKSVKHEIEAAHRQGAITLYSDIGSSVLLESLIPEIEPRACSESLRSQEIAREARLVQLGRVRRGGSLSNIDIAPFIDMRDIQDDYGYDLAWMQMRLQYVRKSPDLAISLLDSSGPGSGGLSESEAFELQDIYFSDLYMHLPARTLLVVYQVHEGMLVTHLVRREGFEVPGPSPILWAPVADLIDQLDSLRLGGDKERRELLARLYKELVSPWWNGHNFEDRIIFVPTYSLYRIPFAALVSPESGRFLVQDIAVGVAPSLSVYLKAVESDRRLSTKKVSDILLVGGSESALRDGGELAALPGTERELANLAAIYKGADVHLFKGKRVTSEAVLSVLPYADLVHFGTHALMDGCSSWCSSLAFSCEQGNTQRLLSAERILRLRLPRTRLVVLAACDTYSGQISPNEGPQSLASAFLEAGVPAVIGSLEPVEDESTARLFIRFHRALRGGADAMAALRTAQVGELSSRPRDWTWSKFQIIGGVWDRRSEEKPATWSLFPPGDQPPKHP
jgi:CHAT domain-containing protein/tetratricopeptide (TPR) repeat protein